MIKLSNIYAWIFFKIRKIFNIGFPVFHDRTIETVSSWVPPCGKLEKGPIWWVHPSGKNEWIPI